MGGSGRDKLKGGRGNDKLNGGKGKDATHGGDGDDIVKGGAGKDYLLGGKGADTFVYTTYKKTAPSKPDTIADFDPAKGDRIDLSGINAKLGVKGLQPLDFIGKHAFSGISGELRVKTGYLSGDADGDRHADFKIKIFDVHIRGGPDLRIACPYRV